MPKSAHKARPSVKLSLGWVGLLLLILIVLLVGCGLKGDLTLEPETPPLNPPEGRSETLPEDEQDDA